MTEHPELAIVTQSPDDPIMVSLVSQFLENEVFFESGENQNLLPSLPADFNSYKAIAFDEPAFAAARGQLIDYASKDGFLLNMKPPRGVDPRDFNVVLMLDHLTFAQAHDLILCAGLQRFHPGLRRVQLARTDQQLLAELKPRLLKSVSIWEGWHEFNLYYWKAALRLAEAGHADAREALITGIRNAAKIIPSALTIDYMSGYFGAVWLCDQTGERGPLERVIANVDEVIVRRPRHMSLLTSCGFADDPLGLKDKGNSLEAYYDSNWNTAREIIWTESMLMHGPTFAALARATGDQKYREEIEKLLSHLERCHVRKDGLLWHCTRGDQPGGGAWTRGQSHALQGLLYVLDEFQPRDPLYERSVGLIRKVCRALLPHQDPQTGMWRNVINIPQARLESTGTMIFTLVCARGINQGWLDRKEFEPAVRRAWDGIKTRYWRGRVAGSCRGTAGAVDDAYYLARPQGGSSGSTTAHLLMTLLEIQRL